MTSLSLLVWIALGIALQLAVFLSVVFWKHWQGYQSLRQQTGDLAIALPGPVPEASIEPASAAWAGLRPFRVERKVIEDALQTVCSFYLVPEDGQSLPAFHPGQFLTFSLDVLVSSGISDKIIRCYSLSAAPAPDHYRISVKRIPAIDGTNALPGRSSNFLHDSVGIGDLLWVRAPAGHFYLDRGDAPAVLIAGGIGITPMLSMIDWCLAEQPGRELWLFYGARSSKELVMRRHLESLAASHPGFHLRLCLSAPLPGDLDRPNCRQGRVDLNALRLQLPLKPYHYYICGPRSMLESLVPALAGWGVPEARIHFEAFGPASIRRQPVPSTHRPTAEGAAAGAISVTFARSGKALAWQPADGSLLELAEANGIAIPSGCRAGGCGTCQTTINSGEVGYRQAPDYDPEPGTCLMCVCTPKTSVTLEA
jgi:uncharacterized protein